MIYLSEDRAKYKEARRLPTSRMIRRYVIFWVLFSMPCSALWVAWLLYSGLTRIIRISVFIPVALLVADILVIYMQPVTALASGPLYLWYRLANYVVHGLARGVALGKFVMFHQSYNLIGTSTPFLAQRHIFGMPGNLIFTLPEAITSSLVWAVAYVAVRGILQRARRQGEPIEEVRDTPSASR